MRPFHRGRGGPGGWIILLAPEVHLQERASQPGCGWSIRSWTAPTSTRVAPEEPELA